MPFPPEVRAAARTSVSGQTCSFAGLEGEGLDAPHGGGGYASHGDDDDDDGREEAAPELASRRQSETGEPGPNEEAESFAPAPTDEPGP